MKRERYIEDYEDFEPEMRTWPFVLLSFLLPLVPLLLTIFLGEGFSLLLVLEYVIVLMPLFCTALCIRDGERSWTFIVSSALYLAYVLLEWAVAKKGGKSGYPLSIPFILALTPGTLPLAAYTFFSKRKRSNWIGWALVAFLFSLASAFVTWNESASTLWIIYPCVMVLLSLMLFFVTRRTESTPWYVKVPLILLVLSSFTLYPGFCDVILTGTLNDKINSALRCFMYSFPFWYTLSFLFVFSGLAGKSSYRKALVDDGAEDTGTAGNYDDMSETVVVPPVSDSVPRQSSYTNPPEYSRFDSSSPRREEVREEKTEDTPSRAASTREPQKGDDKWYDFIEGGVRSDDRDTRRDTGSDERRRDGYDYPERRYDERDRDYYRDDRERRDRYDDRDRYYRDDRERRDRYDDRDRYYRDDRRYDDRDRDYRRSLRYDDDYYRYDDRDRRD